MGLLGGIIGGIIGLFAGPVGVAVGFTIGYGVTTYVAKETILEDILFKMPDMPDMPDSPTYGTDRIGNTISEGYPVSRCYGKCKIGGNKLRFNDAADTDLRIIVAHCRGPVSGILSWQVNDIDWASLTGSHTKTEYTGTRAQTADARFSSRASAYRSMAYTAFTFAKNDQQIGHDPNITVVMESLLCAPLAGGADAFTRNNAVILYDWYLNVEGYAAGSLDLNAFKSLEAFCDAVPTGGSLPRYRFDFNIDTDIEINDAKKLIWQSFNGRVIMSQGKLKPVWDSAQMANGTGGLTAKTVSHAFTEDNIVKDSLTWRQPERPNVVRIHFKDSAKNYKSSSVEIKDSTDIDNNGEILYEEKAWWITDQEIARRRAKCKFDRFKYGDCECSLTAFSGAGDLEVYDLTTVTHTLPGWTTKQFIVTSKGEDHFGRVTVTLFAHYAGVYDDAQVGTQANYESTLPNPYDAPAASTNISATLISPGVTHDYDSVRVSFTPPAGDPFYASTEAYISTDDSIYYFAGSSSGANIVIQGMGTFYQPGDTVYIKLRSISEMGVKASLPGPYDASVVITSSIRLGGFYAGLTFLADNPIEAAAKIYLDKTNTLLRLGPTSGDYLILDGDYGGVPAVVTSNYVSGYMGVGLLLKSDLLEVGNIACRGIFRTNIFQKDSISVVGGSIAVLAGDVLSENMTIYDTASD
uniref:Tip attachment protein J domain-containing protein n=1 Tax=Candidatus Desulfatibia profunda TaxID=2841695 RepID=A0A8J6NVH6_9BACT|nr:hypothetical protein [Candidatus Desulfatibia profunda]